jgi:hypothetical protein
VTRQTDSEWLERANDQLRTADKYSTTKSTGKSTNLRRCKTMVKKTCNECAGGVLVQSQKYMTRCTLSNLAMTQGFRRCYVWSSEVLNERDQDGPLAAARSGLYPQHACRLCRWAGRALYLPTWEQCGCAVVLSILSIAIVPKLVTS